MAEKTWLTPEQRHRQEELLLANIILKWNDLEKLWRQVNDKWVYEDATYRFYHQSFKVYYLQSHTSAIVELLQSLMPQSPLNDWFMQIVRGGTGKEFVIEDNFRWPEVTRPILEAFFHARYFLEMICKYGRQLKEPPALIPCGWGAVLYLFNIR